MQYDLIVIGAGLVGLSTGYQLKVKNPNLKIAILEKESGVAKHQSGNNSGVIHSGIYYKPGSLKAKNCIEGYQSIIEFAQKYNIPFDLCGKIIVAKNEKELPLLETIFNRGVENGLKNLKYLSKSEFQEIEPHCKGVKAIKVPQTGIIDYIALAETIKNLFQELGGEIFENEKVIAVSEINSNIIIKTEKKEYETKKINFMRWFIFR